MRSTSELTKIATKTPIKVSNIRAKTYKKVSPLGIESRDFEWAWLGVWERNFKAQDFYYRFGFERFSEHQYITGDTVDTDWLLRKKLT